MSATATDRGDARGPAASKGPLRLPAARVRPPADVLRELRRFHLGLATGQPLPDDSLPALLAPFREPALLRHDYPLRIGDDLQPEPLTDLLAAAVPEGARVLRDNLARLERHARQLLQGEAGAELRDLVARAGEAMLAELELQPGVAEAARKDLDSTVRELPEGGLLPLTVDSAGQLLAAAAGSRVRAARDRYRQRLQPLVEGLRDLLAVEAGKEPEARQPDKLEKALGPVADRFLDPAALARAVGPHRGSTRAGAELRQKLQRALQVLEAHLQASPADEVLTFEGDDALEAATAAFDRHAGDLAEIVRAARLAELELRSAYDPSRHDPALAELDWQGFSEDELHVLPVVVAATRAETVARSGLGSLSRLLLSGRPVQVLVLQSPARDPAADDEESAWAEFRLELAYLGVAHREAFVQQSTAARPAHLLAGFQRALAGTRAALHVVDTGLDAAGQPPRLGAFLHAGAAIEGRAHPLFHYDPEAGDTWARRLDFDHNPQPDDDWPRSKLTCDGGQELELAFTFADFALLEPALQDQFALVPDDWQSEDLVPLADHLSLAGETAARSVPFVWIATADGGLHRAAVRRPLEVACRDRLRFWHTLQELAGVRNEYVREAVQKARQEAAEQAERERQALQAEHERQLEQVRQEAAASAMANLARMLLELDPLASAPPAAEAAPAPPAPQVEAAAPAEAAPATPETGTAEAPPQESAAAADDDDLSFDEPWIESARCSSCNDCINLNPLLFVYDENKQARIGDLSKGTYAQLVQAAEKCPARCIHPGKPWNPDEPNLEELIARAEPFNH